MTINIRKIRKQIGLSQTELSKLLFMTQQNLSRMERGMSYFNAKHILMFIAIAKEKGLDITFRDIYQDEQI